MNVDNTQLERSVREILADTSKVVHDYDPVYSLIPRRGIRYFLEVGTSVKSLTAYAELFPFAACYGMDVVSQPEIVPPLNFLQANAYTSVLELPRMDLIVDDAVHNWEQQVLLQRRLNDFLNPGGWYVIEDIFQPNEIKRAFPKAYVVRTGRKEDSVIALMQKEW